jgi:hypothetical protein
MIQPFTAAWLLAQEARALLTRLARLRPYSLSMPMVPAAAIPPAAQSAIENHMIQVRRRLRTLVASFLRWLEAGPGQTASPASIQRRFTFLRMRFNSVISQFDIFADVLTQRSEHGVGVWVAGLDDVAADALRIPGSTLQAPPVICYVDRGHGAAIRRARTRLPGGEENPVAIIRVPRERMVGSGIASSLVHEVGHQAAAMLDLVNPLRPVLQRMADRQRDPVHASAWKCWERWISEIVADLWSVSRIGISSTLGLIGVVSLPRAFVFRLDLEDPHPAPWIRVKLSCAMGHGLYPHPQWARLADLWESFYPPNGLDPAQYRLLRQLEATFPEFVNLLLAHRPRALAGRNLGELLRCPERTPVRLAELYRTWGGAPARLAKAPPSLAFAVIGQARAEGQLEAETESQLLASLLTYWATQSALTSSAQCARANHHRLTDTADQMDRPTQLFENEPKLIPQT